LVEQLDYNLLFRWFVGLGVDDAVWNDTVFSKTATGSSQCCQGTQRYEYLDRCNLFRVQFLLSLDNVVTSMTPETYGALMPGVT
jgi:hypothetical protein